MFRLSPSQLEALDRAAARRFRQRMVRHLQRCFPGACGSSPTGKLPVWVQRHMQQAAQMGLTSRQDVCRYLNLVAGAGCLSTTLTSVEWAAGILGRSDISARGRLLLLERALLKRLDEGGCHHE